MSHRFADTFRAGSALLTPRSRVMHKKLTGSPLIKKFPAFSWNSKVHYRIHKCPPPVPILSQLDPVHTSTSHFLKIQLNIFLPSMPGSPKWSLSLRFPHQKPICASLLSHKRYMPRPSHSSRFYYRNNIGWGVQIIKLLITRFPLFTCYLVPFKPPHSQKMFKLIWHICYNSLFNGKPISCCTADVRRNSNCYWHIFVNSYRIHCTPHRNADSRKVSM